MSGLRIIYVISLVILGTLLVFTVFRPVATSGEYGEVRRAQLLQTDDEWIIQFDLINHEDRKQDYTMAVLVDGKRYTEDVSILSGRVFTYIHRIPRATAGAGDVGFTIYKEGEADPLEQVTYYLK